MRSKIWLILGFLSLFVAACNSQAPAVSDSFSVIQSQPWIDAPLPNAVLPLEPYKIVFHAANRNGISEFEVSINGNVVGSTPSNNAPSDDQEAFFYGEYSWNPTEAGIYLISVRAKDGQGEYNASAEVQVTIKGEDTVEDEVTEECIYTAVVNLFCRLGPSSSLYPEIDSFTSGQSASVLGQSQDGVFIAVAGPNFGETCYVPSAADFGELTGSCSDLSVLTPPPVPDSSTDSPNSTPVQGCTVKIIGSSEVSCVVPCPDGAEPGDACTP